MGAIYDCRFELNRFAYRTHKKPRLIFILKVLCLHIYIFTKKDLIQQAFKKK